MKQLTKILLAIFFAGVFTTACNNNNNNNPQPTTGGTGGGGGSQSFSAFVDGQSFAASSYNNTLFKGDDGMGNLIKRLDIRAMGPNSSMLIISASDWRDGTTGDNFQLGTYFQEATLNPYDPVNDIYAGILITYVTSTQSCFSEFTGSGYLKITANDPTAKKISGDFMCDVIEVTTQDTIMTTGTFSKMVYTVLQ